MSSNSASCSPDPQAVSSTTSSAGVHVLAPKLAASSPAVLSDVPGIMTRREWIIPPRPKPGRKPATDTPPTKRKAQNRAAQRAFRERRAQRVNELEDKIKEIEAETANQTQSAHDEVRRLKYENIKLSRENSQLRLEMEKLQNSASELHQRNMDYQLEVVQLQQQTRKLIEERSLKIAQLASPAPSPEETHENSPPVPFVEKPVSPLVVAAASLPERPVGTEDPRTSPVPASPAEMVSCLQENGTCACAENTLSSTNQCYSSSQTEVIIHRLPSKRPISSVKLSTHKRSRHSNGMPSLASSDLEMEVDFTSRFGDATASNSKAATSQPSSTSTNASSASFAPGDLCGFCSDGTPCVCAEMALVNDGQEKGLNGWDNQENMKLPPLLIEEGSPEEIDFTNSFNKRNDSSGPKRSAAPAIGECGATSDGPGTCDMCQKDPLAMLFCQTMASRIPKRITRSLPSSSITNANSGCCMTGSSALPGGCCMLRAPKPINGNALPATPPPKALTPSESAPKRSPKEPMYLPCSAAYKTISRHRNWKEASIDDFPRLVRPLMVSTGGNDNCPQIEVGSITDVLRMLDRRFVKNSGVLSARKDVF